MEKKEFKKHALIIFVVAVLTIIGMELVTARYGLYVTRKDQDCLGYAFMWVKNEIVPHDYRKYVSFYSRGVPQFQDGITTVKVIAGLPGDKVEVNVYTEPEREESKFTYQKRGEHIIARMQGKVRLSRRDGSVMEFSVQEKDSLGRPLPITSDMVIPEGKYFVVGAVERSFDSRYWGLIDENQVIGEAFPMPFGIGKRDIDHV